ncbi:MAG TPA: energy transducer TonB [Gammaproteobacteria bacterium]
MAAIYPNPPVTSSDRLGLTLFFAVIFHAVIILGVTFSPGDDQEEDYKQPPLEITLVHQKSDKAPEEAELLAQANLEGGGIIERKIRHTSPVSIPTNSIDTGLSTSFSIATPPRQNEEPRSSTLTQDNPALQIPDEKTSPVQEHNLQTATDLMARGREIANLSAEIDQSLQLYSERLRHRYISARTREYRDAAYLDAWRMKIERIGNLNYPEQAKQRNLSGNLILDVALNADGSVHSITLRRSSGHKILDDAAIRIVNLAAPFAPFPEELRKDTDVLHITRTWQFLDGHQFQTER